MEKDPDELSKNDRIYLELFFNLDYYWKARMRGLELRRNFIGIYDDFRKKLGVIQEASQGLRNSTNFREFLDVTAPKMLMAGYLDGWKLYERLAKTSFRFQTAVAISNGRSQR